MVLKVDTDYQSNVIDMFTSRFSCETLTIDGILSYLDSIFDKHFLNQFFLDSYDSLYDINPDHFWIRLERLIWFSLMYDIQLKEGVVL